MSQLTILILEAMRVAFGKAQRPIRSDYDDDGVHPTLKGGMAYRRIRWYAQDNRGSLMNPCNDLPA